MKAKLADHVIVIQPNGESTRQLAGIVTDVIAAEILPAIKADKAKGIKGRAETQLKPEFAKITTFLPSGGTGHEVLANEEDVNSDWTTTNRKIDNKGALTESNESVTGFWRNAS